MAIALVSTAEKESSGSSVGSLTFPVYVPPGENRILMVAVAFLNVSSRTISTVTHGGVSLTKTDGAAANMDHVNGTSVRVEMWKLTEGGGLLAGTNNVVITFSGNISLPRATASVWTGVHQTTPLGTWAEAAGSSTNATATVAVSSASGEVVVDTVGGFTGTFLQTLTVGSGQTVLEQAGNSTSIMHGSSYEAGAASVTMSWTMASGGTHTWAIGGVPLKPATDTSPPAASGTAVAEIAVLPWRAGPEIGFQSATADRTSEHSQIAWELAGAMPKVLIGSIRGESIVWDDVYTINSVSPAGPLALTAHPTPMTPGGGALFAATQDVFVQWPFPVSFEPHLSAFPALAKSDSTHAELTPHFYPSAVDFGDVVELRYLEVYAQNMTRGTDSIRVAFTWDDTQQWYNGDALAENYCMWEFAENFGRILRVSVSINDADDAEPVGPTITKVVGWWRFRPDKRMTMPAGRADPEVS